MNFTYAISLLSPTAIKITSTERDQKIFGHILDTFWCACNRCRSFRCHHIFVVLNRRNTVLNALHSMSKAEKSNIQNPISIISIYCIYKYLSAFVSISLKRIISKSSKINHTNECANYIAFTSCFWFFF